ncbi:hypothetical protein ACIPLC_36400 [Kitasatospora sp. NPDC086801]|uniref:hypothetical protein n=1 Tax=Kitasatospora sp. NPDC086801 TaxID=3364066 RepID=UPI00380A0373
MPRRTVLGAVVLALLTTAALPADAVHGEPPAPGPSPVGREVLQRQEVLDRLADQITPVPEHQRADVPGYAGLTVDPEQGRLTVYWHGNVPERVTSLIANPPAGITAHVFHAPYSLAQLRSARDRLVAAARGEAGAAWTVVGPAADGTGLSLTYTPAGGLPTARTAGGSAERERIAARAAELAGVPVDAAPGLAPQATGTRHSDANPWSGGAQLTTPSGDSCSSAFGGWRGKTAVMLTAHHCGDSGAYKNGTGTVVGSVADSNSDLDTAVISLNGTPSGQFYYGGWDNAQGERRRTVGAGRNNVGDLVCDSGSMSGAHCALKITRTDTSTNVDGVWRSDLDYATRTDDHTIAVAQGDSGGPVVASVNGGDDMQARGIVSAGGGSTVTCKWGTDTAAKNVTCWDTLAFVPIGPVIDKFGISLA